MSIEFTFKQRRQSARHFAEEWEKMRSLNAVELLTQFERGLKSANREIVRLRKLLKKT